MTSSNGNIFRVTGPLCGEFTGPGEFPTQRPVTRSFDVFFDLRLNKRLSKQPWGWWFEPPSWSLWRHRNVFDILIFQGTVFEWKLWIQHKMIQVSDHSMIVRIKLFISTYTNIFIIFSVLEISHKSIRQCSRCVVTWWIYFQLCNYKFNVTSINKGKSGHFQFMENVSYWHDVSKI